MRLGALQNVKAIYRVTGTPENYLTALRSSTWGFKDDPKLRSQWKKLQPGDIIFFHSSQSGSRFLKKSELSSKVVGFGVVGNHFFEGEEPLWIEEFEEQKVIYPWRFHFSEIYLFADIPAFGDWESQNLSKAENARALLKQMLAAGIPLSEMPQFPRMGSYSSIQDENTKAALLTSTKGLYAYQTRDEEEDALPSRQAEIREIHEPAELQRDGGVLLHYEDVGPRVLKLETTRRDVNLRQLQAAENAHAEILSVLFNKLRERGYDCFKNNHIDLLAVNSAKGRSLLIEAKSNEGDNFRAQARKGIAQLFEYNYFEMERFKEGRGLELRHEHQVLALSQEPRDQGYLGFLNHLKIRTLVARSDNITPVGDLADFAELSG